MNVTVTYTVNCSHEAFTEALAKHMKDVKFHDVAWRDTENYGDDSDPDFISTFSWPNKRHPELTKNLFWKMATTSLANSRHAATAMYLHIESEDKSFSITDGWNKDGGHDGEGARLRYDEKAFSKEMASRLNQIATLACGHEEGDW